MKRTMLAGVGLMIATAAQAQVKLSGTVDVAFRRDGGMPGGPVNTVGQGMNRSSRLLVESKEELGDGFVAHALLEGNFSPDTGAFGTSTAFWSRVSIINVGSDKTGYISLGRQYTPIQDVSASGSADPFAGASLGGTGTVMARTVNANNGVVYHYGMRSSGTIYPVPAKGLAVVALWAPGEGGSATTPTRSGDQMGIGASYGWNNWWLGSAFHMVRGNSNALNPALPTTDRPILKQYYVGGAYDFKIFRSHFGVFRGKNDAFGSAEVNRLSWTAGITVPLGTGNFRALYGKANDVTAANRDLSTLQAQYTYDFSLRTAAYVFAGAIRNSATSSATFLSYISTVPNGATVTSTGVGIRHIF